MNAQMRQAIFEAIGEASMCWSNIDKAGVFESTRAQDIGERLVKTLAVPKEIKFEWSLKDGGPTLECTVNGRAVGFVWHNTLADWYVSHKIMGTDRYETEAEARDAVEESLKLWLRGIYGS